MWRLGGAKTHVGTTFWRLGGTMARLAPIASAMTPTETDSADSTPYSVYASRRGHSTTNRPRTGDFNTRPPQNLTKFCLWSYDGGGF